MNKKSNTKKTLGIAIPYFRITCYCDGIFKKLMNQLDEQLTDDMIIYIYEDGQESDWLKEYIKENIIVETNNINYGVAYARNKCLDYLIDKVNYILYIDSDDRLDDDYLEKMYKECKKCKHEIYESGFYVNEQKCAYDENVIRCGVSGSAIKTDIIGDVRFNNKLQIGEDTDFMGKIVDIKKYKKKFVDTNYYYQFGINEFSLIKRYQNKMIGKER